MASQVPTPNQVRYCNPDADDRMIPPSQQLKTFSQGEPSFVHSKPGLTAAGGSQAAGSTSTSLKPQLWDASFDQDFDLSHSQELASSVTFVAMSDQSSFKSIPDGSFRELY